ncbi:MAG: hypothetical protein HQK52_16680 [Oligoflexia bacterium]|nr:hypothetical protein [Oligoflexia bacterium]
MKKILFISFGIVCFAVIAGLAIYFYPYVLYYRIIQGKYDGEYYKVKNIERYLNPNAKDLLVDRTQVLGDSDEENYWKTFHIGQYKLLLPLSHPLIGIFPIVNFKEDKKEVELGIKFMTYRGEKITEIALGPEERFAHKFNEQKLFAIPMIYRYLERVSIEDLWRDIFEKRIIHRYEEGISVIDCDKDKDKDKECSFFKKKKQKVKKVFGVVYDLLTLDFSEMIYNLYVIHMREKYFPGNFNDFFYYADKNYGVLISRGKDSYRNRVTFYSLGQGVVQSYAMELDLQDPLAHTVFKKMLQHTFYAPSTLEESQNIYREFVELPYKQKIDQEGMIYLFSAWTNDVENKEFLFEVIKFLEKGGNNFARLQPFYVYASKRYGNGDDANSERQEAQLKEKIKSEDLANIEQADRDNRNSVESVPTSAEERFRFYLKKANEVEKSEKPKAANEVILD